MKAAINRRAAQLSKLAIKLNSEDFTVFCNFAGHVKGITLAVHPKGWEKDNCASYTRTVYLDQADSMEKLEAAIVELQELKNGG